MSQHSRAELESIHEHAGAAASSDTIHDEAQGTVVLPKTPAAEPEEELLDCPRCGSELSDPVHTGWCLRCGYCRYLEKAQRIAPLKEPPRDPEIQAYLDLLRSLSRSLKRVQKRLGATDPQLAKYMDLVASLTSLCRKKGQTAADVGSYRDLLLALGKKLENEPADEAHLLGHYQDLLQALADKYQRELRASRRNRDSLLAALGLPIPALELIPEWFAVLACGLVICVMGSIMAGLNLRTSPHSRAIWCTGQAVLAAVVVLGAYVSAFGFVVPSGLRRQQWGLLIHPRDLWWAVWQRLPDTAWPVWLLGWGVALLIGAAFIAGV